MNVEQPVKMNSEIIVFFKDTTHIVYNSLYIGIMLRTQAQPNLDFLCLNFL